MPLNEVIKKMSTKGLQFHYYNSYKNEYYRILTHRYHSKNADGTVNRSVDLPWSLLVLDKDFNVIKEVVFPAQKFNNNFISVCKEGILIGDYRTTTNEKYTQKYALFNL